MKRKLVTLTLAAVAAFAGHAAQASDQLADKVIRGRYQAVLGDCAACHTRQDGKPFAGGEPLQTPFGVLVPPNITPDRETGIGAWSEEDFRNALKTGIGHGGKRLYPAMPYPAYTKMPDGDIADLWAYMQTLEPVHNPVEANQLPFPLNIRTLMAAWNGINFTPEPFRPDPNQSDEWNRGAYLVQGPGHCGTCHSPKTLLGADKTSEALQGASLQGWYAPAITGDTVHGIGGWSEDELVQYLKTGTNGHTIASGPMAEAIEQYQALRPDVMTLDITMPEKDGLAALREIMAADPGAKVVMCSALGQESKVLESIKLGAKDFVVKPFQPDRVLSAIDKALA